MFLEKGYNVLTYDQRSSNENTAEYTTFGYLEKYDLTDYIDYISQQAPGQIIGVWGTSFGRATAGLAVESKETEGKIDFLILDCPVSDMKWMLENELRNMDIGISISYMTFCGNIVNRRKLASVYKGQSAPSRVISDIFSVILNQRTSSTPQSSALKMPEIPAAGVYESRRNRFLPLLGT